MFKILAFVFLLSSIGLASEQCFSVQILEVNQDYLIENKLEQKDMPSGCKLINIEGRFYGRCGCYSSRIEALKSLNSYPNFAKDKPSVENTKRFRFELGSVSYKQFDKKGGDIIRVNSSTSNPIIKATSSVSNEKISISSTSTSNTVDRNSTDTKMIKPPLKIASDFEVKNNPNDTNHQKNNNTSILIDNTEIRIPVWFMQQMIFVLGILSFITFIFIITYKIYVEKKQRNTNKLKTDIQSDIEKAITSKNFNKENFMTPVTQSEFYSFADVAIDFINNIIHIGNGSKNNIHNLLDDKNVIKYLKTLSSKKWSLSRIESIEKLGLMHYEKNKFFLFSLIENESSSSRIVKQAIIGLSYIIRPDDIRFFLDEFVKTKASGKYIEFVFTNIIQRMKDLKQDDSVIDVLYYLYQIDNNHLFIRPFVEAIGYTGFDCIQDEFYDLYFMSQSNNVKSSIVRAIGVLKQNDKCDEIILMALKSEDDILRIAAAKSLVVVDTEKHSLELFTILLDKNYNVRLNAAVSLSQSLYGLKLLEQIFESSTDIYAKEMAKYAIVVAERDKNNKPKIMQ